MALTKTERRALEVVLKNLDYEHLKQCHFVDPDGDRFDNKFTLKVAESTRLYLESWVIPVIQAVLQEEKSFQRDSYLKIVTRG